ncbi:MAG TPA: TonB-dependent receptor, partial [Planctomycetota bacterium]|nr:TonB-dependent receptor [Planctomycetota bacterium]
VITSDDIRRSGATTIADALRLAPGVEVARIDANKWAISIRGFQDRLSRSVLVLVDGRAVYSPLFAGTYWEAQDTLLADIDRIEVIRGPGGAIYGANAVNGVINIITRSARDTQGVYATAAGGTEERWRFGARYGGSVGEDFHWRVYAKGFEREPMYHRTTDDFDLWRQVQGGFRCDWTAGEADLVTAQGDIYVGEAGDHRDISSYDPPSIAAKEGEDHLGGGNVVSRWTHRFAERSTLQVQAYYDRTQRRELNYKEERDTFDLQAQHEVALPLGQDLIYGVEYRLSSGLAHGIETIVFDPARRTEQLFAAFLQDEVTLVPDLLKVTAGCKLEHNVYTGFEVHPSGRIALTPAPDHLIWAAVSRTVRAPSRVDRDLEATIFAAPGPVYVRQIGDGAFRSERLLAVEAGYRFAPVDWLAGDAALFYDRYSDLESPLVGSAFVETAPGEPTRFVLPVFLRNGFDANAYGAEVALDWVPVRGWRLRGAYSFLKLDLSGLDLAAQARTEESSPVNQLSARSSIDLPGDVELDATVRYVDDLPARGVGSYTTIDARVAWHPTEHVEVFAVGQNLLEDHHAEFPGDGSAALVDIRRSAYAGVTIRW